MSDLAELIVAVVALYLAECFMWVRRGGIVLHARGAGPSAKHRISRGSTSLGNTRGGLIFLDPLPPLGSAFVCFRWPIALDRDGAFSFVAQTLGKSIEAGEQAGRYVCFDDIQSITRATGEIHINGKLFADLAEAPLARRFVRLLKDLQGRKPDQRDAAIDRALAAATDLDAARAALTQYHKAARALRWFCHTLFVLMLIVLPAVLLVPQIYNFWLEWLLAVLLCVVAIGFCFFKAHRKLFPDGGEDRWLPMLEIILLPLAAIRASVTLSRHVLIGFDPLTSAAILCDEKVFLRFARSVLLDLRHPCLSGRGPQDQAAQATETSFRNRLRAALEKVVANSNHDVASLTASPAANEASSRSFCPRCDMQYAIDEGTCSDCGGIPLQPLSARPIS